MQRNLYNHLSDEQLLEQIAAHATAESEAKAAAQPLREEMLLRQLETGETNFKHNGWESRLTKEKISAAWVARQYGYPKEEIPPECFDEVVKPELNPEKVVHWLHEAGHEVKPSYSLTVAREKPKTLINRK